MILQWPNWQIESYEKGFKLRRRVNETRWIAEGYYPNLATAVQGLFDLMIRTETDEFTVQSADPNSAGSSMAELLCKIELIANELAEVVREAGRS